MFLPGFFLPTQFGFSAEFFGPTTINFLLDNPFPGMTTSFDCTLTQMAGSIEINLQYSDSYRLTRWHSKFGDRMHD